MTGSLAVSVTSEFQFRCGIHSPLQANQTSITQSFQANRNFQSTQVPMFLLALPKHNVELLVDSWANQTSWIRGLHRRSHRKLLAVGLMTRSCLTTFFQWMFAHRLTTSSVHGCLQQQCDHTSNTTLHHGRTLRCRDGFLIQIARRCRNQKATL